MGSIACQVQDLVAKEFVTLDGKLGRVRDGDTMVAIVDNSTPNDSRMCPIVYLYPVPGVPGNEAALYQGVGRRIAKKETRVIATNFEVGQFG